MPVQAGFERRFNSTLSRRLNAHLTAAQALLQNRLKISCGLHQLRPVSAGRNIMPANPYTLATLNDDVLVHLASFLPPAAILALRAVSRRFDALTRLHAVWRGVYAREVWARNLPSTVGDEGEEQGGRAFPAAVGELGADELERVTRRALSVARAWEWDPPRNTGPGSTGGATHPHQRPPPPRPTAHTFRVSPSSAVALVRFLPARPCAPQRLVTVSKGIWSEVAVWEVGAPEGVCAESTGHTHGDENALGNARRLAVWSPKGAIFRSIAVNDDPNEEGVLAVSTSRDGTESIDILALDALPLAPASSSPPSSSPTHTLRTLVSYTTPLHPVALHGPWAAFADRGARTSILVWRECRQAVLDSSTADGFDAELGLDWIQDNCRRVLFTHESAVVVRARSVCIFPRPTHLSPPRPRAPPIHPPPGVSVQAPIFRLDDAEVVQPNINDGLNLNHQDAEDLASSSASSSLRAGRKVVPPTYAPLARHSFGWIDGVAVVRDLTHPLSRQCNAPLPPTRSDGWETIPGEVATAEGDESDTAEDERSGAPVDSFPPLMLLLRAESDDPWSSDVHSLELYLLPRNPNRGANAASTSASTTYAKLSTATSTAASIPASLLPEAGPPATTSAITVTFTPTTASTSGSSQTPSQHASPYTFPPHLTSTIPSVRGFLRCTDLCLGPRGSALWIEPRASGPSAFDIPGPTSTSASNEISPPPSQNEEAGYGSSGGTGLATLVPAHMADGPGSYGYGYEGPLTLVGAGVGVGAALGSTNTSSSGLGSTSTATHLAIPGYRARKGRESLVGSVFDGPLRRVRRVRYRTRRASGGVHGRVEGSDLELGGSNSGSDSDSDSDSGVRSVTDTDTAARTSASTRVIYEPAPDALDGDGAAAAWTSLDYAEARGLVALGSSAGSVTVLDLAGSQSGRR